MTLMDTEPAVVSAGEDDMRQYLSEIRRYPRLTVEEERDLARRCAEGDQDAIRREHQASKVTTEDDLMALRNKFKESKGIKA